MKKRSTNKNLCINIPSESLCHANMPSFFTYRTNLSAMSELLTVKSWIIKKINMGMSASG